MMKEIYKEIAAFAFVVIFAASFFMAVPRQYPHVASYKFALETEKAIKSGAGTEPFYEFSRYVYVVIRDSGFFGQNADLAGDVEFDRVVFGLVIMYLPVLLGLVCAAAFYLSVRSRFGVEISVLGAVLLICSPSFLTNSLTGVYTPEMLGLAIFSLSLALFLGSDVVKPTALGIVLALIAGAVLGASLAVSEAGVLLGTVMVASAAAQLIYYIKERDYQKYAARFAALVVPAAMCLPYARTTDIGSHFNFDDALGAYAVLLPLVVIFAFVAIRDLVNDTKKYELFFLAMTVGSVGIALFDPVAAAPGIGLGAVFGAVTVKEHLREKWLMFLFVALVVGSALFLVLMNFMREDRGLALSALMGLAFAGVFLLYENEVLRTRVALAGVALVVAVSVLSGIVIAQLGYSGVDDKWGNALLWAKTGLPKDAVIGAIAPKGITEYIAERKGCDCNDAVARYLLGSGNTSELKQAGATHIVVDEAYFNELDRIALVGNVTRIGVEAYFFSGYYRDPDRQKYYAYFVAKRGVMRIPVDLNGEPDGEDVLVEGIGSVPYGKIRAFGGGDGFGLGSRVVLPLYGERNNLFDIYFETPNGLELVYPTGKDAVRIYKIE